jgi:hypothetical protein
VSKLCKAIGVATAAELYVTLRDDYGLYLVLLSSDNLSLNSEATEILLVDTVKAPEELKLGRVRRVVTGAPRFRMAWALSPLTLGAGSKDVVFARTGRTRWVLHASFSIAQAAEALCGYRSVCAAIRRAELAPMCDPAAEPRAVASEFMFGNQGNRCFQRMREVATRAVRARVQARARQVAGLARCVRRLPDSIGLARRCSARDVPCARPSRPLVGSKRARAARVLDRARAGAGCGALPATRRHRDGGDPNESEDPYEAANFELVAGFVRALANDTTLAPQIDRQHNLQAQLDRLEPEEIAEIARRIAASRTELAEVGLWGSAGGGDRRVRRRITAAC